MIALEGKFEGRVIATTEAIALRDVEFHRERIYGYPTAVWGATLVDEVTNDRNNLRGLGIGRPFDTRPRIPVEFKGTHYVDANGKRLVRANFLNLFKSGMFYR